MIEVLILILPNVNDIDIRTVDKDSVVDISTVKVNMDLPKLERMKDVVQQMNGNPYLFRSGKILVKISFADTPITIDERMEDYLRTL